MNNRIKQKKILIAAGIFPPDIGGPASYVRRLATELSNSGNKVTVVAYADSLKHNDTGFGFRVIRVLRNKYLIWRYFKYLRAVFQQALKRS